MEEARTENAFADAPLDELTVKGVADMLKAKGLNIVMGIAELCNAVGTINPRGVRDRIANGSLRTYKREKNIIVLHRDDVAAWLVEHPEYLIRRQQRFVEMTNEEFAALSARIRKHVSATWQPLLKYVEMQDIISEVAYRISRQCANTTVSENTRIFRAVNDIYRREKRRIHATNMDMETLESTTEE